VKKAPADDSGERLSIFDLDEVKAPATKAPPAPKPAPPPAAPKAPFSFGGGNFFDDAGKGPEPKKGSASGRASAQAAGAGRSGL